MRERHQLRHVGALALAVFILWTIPSCKRPRQLPAQEVLLQIELDAFSGQPNPRWELTKEQAVEFLRQFRALRAAPAGHSGGQGLGYRGFIVTSKGRLLNGYENVRLYRGYVFAQRGDPVETFHDQERRLEHWLLDSARGHVPESVLPFVQEQIER